MYPMNVKNMFTEDIKNEICIINFQMLEPTLNDEYISWCERRITELMNELKRRKGERE